MDPSNSDLGTSAKDKFFAPFDNDVYQTQVEKGNITEGDLAVLRSIDLSWNYARIGLFVGSLIPSVYGRLIRRPPWPLARTFGLSTIGAVAGSAVGQAYKYQYAFKRMRELEDVDRFGRALKEMDTEMKRRKGFAVPQGGISRGGGRGQTQGSPGRREESGAPGDEQQERPYSDGYSQPKPEVVTSSAEDSSSKPNTRWNEIRSARPATQPTSWDLIRQAHEKQHVPNSNSSPSPSRGAPPPPDTSSSDDSEPRSPRDEEREREQREFNSLLDAERKLSDDSDGRNNEGGQTWSRRKWN